MTYVEWDALAGETGPAGGKVHPSSPLLSSACFPVTPVQVSVAAFRIAALPLQQSPSMKRPSDKITDGPSPIKAQPVGGATAVHVLVSTVSGLKVQRQKLNAYREAIQELRNDPCAGFEKLGALGAVREVAWTECTRAVAAAYADALLRGHKTLVVCPTHDEIEGVTDAIRSNRKRAGELAGGVQLTRHVSLNWTTAQKQNTRNYRPGQLLRFQKKYKGIKKNETIELITVEDNRVRIRNASGENFILPGKQAKAFDVVEQQSIEVAPADKLLITANRREAKFRATNGEIVTVSNIDEVGRVHLEDGRVVPPSFEEFADAASHLERVRIRTYGRIISSNLSRSRAARSEVAPNHIQIV